MRRCQTGSVGKHTAVYRIGSRALLCGAAWSTFAAVASGNEASPTSLTSPVLFADAAGWEDPGPAVDPTIMRGRPVKLDLEGLLAAARGSDGTLAFELFDDVRFRGTVERAEGRTPDSYTFIGRLSGEPDSSFTLVVRGEVVVGNIRVPSRKAYYQIRYLGHGVHVVRQIDESKYPPCCGVAQPKVAPRAIQPPVPRRPLFRCDGRSLLIDVLVVYTPAAREAAGGTEAMNAQIDLAVAESNTAYTNSLIHVQLRLVYTSETDYEESGGLDDLNRLTDPDDGYMDEVHTLRNVYGADLVTLLDGDGSCGGIAWMMTELSPDFEDLAFSVVSQACAAGTYTFAHELGHNMGCHHDRANAGGPGVFDFSYGYQNPDELFRTVMAYDCPGGCPRVQHFSNPDVTYSGLPTGVFPARLDSAHNALTINLTAATVAGFRQSTDCNGNGISDDQDISGETSEDCNTNGTPDECEFDCNSTAVPDDCDIAEGTSEDCNENGIPDECDVGDGMSIDCNGNDVPDECEGLTPAEPPQPVPSAVEKVRYLTFAQGSSQPAAAIRITFVELPEPFDIYNGTTMWVGPPKEVSENAGKINPADAPDFPVFWAATLQCLPYYADWSTYDSINIYHRLIIPDGTYALAALAEGCDPTIESGYGQPLELITSRWGDVVRHCIIIPCGAPDGEVNVPDITAVLDKFKNLPGGPIKARADLEPATPDLQVNITDVMFVVDAFRGFTYPFAPGLPPCGK